MILIPLLAVAGAVPTTGTAMAVAQDTKTLSCSVVGTEVDTNGFGESRTRDRAEDLTLSVAEGGATLTSDRRGTIDLAADGAVSYRGDDVRNLTNGGGVTYTYAINRSTGRITVTQRMTRKPRISGSWDWRWDASGTCEVNGAARF